MVLSSWAWNCKSLRVFKLWIEESWVFKVGFAARDTTYRGYLSCIYYIMQRYTTEPTFMQQELKRMKLRTQENVDIVLVVSYLLVIGRKGWSIDKLYIYPFGLDNKKKKKLKQKSLGVWKVVSVGQTIAYWNCLHLLCCGVYLLHWMMNDQ
jgi:hypothetical protein